MAGDRAIATLAVLSVITACRSDAPPARMAVVDAAMPPAPTRPTVDLEKTARKADEALAYCKAHGLSTDFAILIDGSLHSGLRRFFLWNFPKRRIDHAALVGHGCCDKPWSGTFSREHAG